MGYPRKVATCCYCGSKAVLTIDKGRHELRCANCAAPLRNLKMMPVRTPRTGTAVSHQPSLRHFSKKPKARKYVEGKSARLKKKKAWLKDIAEEVFDFVEDIFD